MNYEKKFEDFLEKMQGLLDNAKKQGHIIVRVEDLENAFPELKENEDEKIRNEIIEHIKAEMSPNLTIPPSPNRMSQWLAWLEKQGEKSVEPVIDFKASDWYVSKVDGKIHNAKYVESEDERIRGSIIDHLKDHNLTEWATWLKKQGEQPNKVSIWKHWKDGISGNGEGKQVYLIKNGTNYSVSSCLGYECDYIELSELDKLYVEKQEWSEEDEKMLKSIISDVRFEGYNQDFIADSCRKIDWLKSLKNRCLPQPKQEWSEKDM